MLGNSRAKFFATNVEHAQLLELCVLFLAQYDVMKTDFTRCLLPKCEKIWARDKTQVSFQTVKEAISKRRYKRKSNRIVFRSLMSAGICIAGT